MSSLLEFRGNWRIYQKRVLLHADDYLKDGRIHIVAAPGSGKTTLGIELIGRIDKPSLILAPSITIREQWIERIKEGFLKDGINAEEWITNDLRTPKFITVATYQALHSAMTRAQGKLSDASKESDEDSDDTPIDKPDEEVDYSEFELITAMKEAKLGIICLDECHHLRSEWWAALENFRKSFKTAKIISLTATPPYDSTPAMWKRYIDMCGEIDEEITIPELVKEGSLCPHQDYVMFNYPTREERSEVEKFKQNSENMLTRLMADKELETVISSHKGLFGETSDDALLDNPAYLSSILIYLQEKGIAFPKRLLSLLGTKKLPDMNEKWMEVLMQGILYDDTDSYICDKVFIEQLVKELKSAGLIDKRKVCLTTSTAVERLLIQSKGKIESIKEIVFHEFGNMGRGLRLLVLTDYIRKECENNLGNLQVEINQLGVLPFFEILRREADKRAVNGEKLRLGVLCGTMVIIPAEAKDCLVKLAGEDKVTFSDAGDISKEDYLVVRPVGDAHFLTAAVTDLFSKGYIQALIGTKSLLGEGWDAPCINSLILASFVGSFMLSNQMRGRAIRIDKSNPDKTSNIWHLVCILPPKDGKVLETDDESNDYKMLTRRMEHFLGLHYEDDTIENGVGRLSCIKPPFDSASIKKTNKEMLSLSDQRETLRKRWQNALTIFDKMEVADEVDISERFISIVAFYDAMKLAAILMILGLFDILMQVVLADIPLIVIAVIAVGLLIGMVTYFVKGLMLSSPLRRLRVFGEGIRKAMIEKGLLSVNCKVECETAGKIYHAIYIKGGTGREKADFAKVVSQFFDEIDNQRYILVNRKRINKLDGFFVVPDDFSKKKEDAALFAESVRPFIGKYELVYTRNEAGRRLLLEGRIKAIANRENRLIQKKKVKGALE